MSFEDEIRETMRAHDSEAPSAHGLVLPSQHTRHTRWVLPAVAAAAVIAVSGAVVAIAHLNGSPTASQKSPAPAHHSAASNTSADCPAQYDTAASDPWVPDGPEGVDAASRMVPDETPTSVRVCAYLHGDDGALTGDRALQGDLDAVTQTLTWLPRGTNSFPCAAYLAVTDGDNYLIGLSYADGRVWVAAPGNHCDGASNGEFRTTMNLMAFADAAYTSGRWDPNAGQPAHPSPCSMSDAGRLGQDQTFVPDAPRGLTICAGPDGQDEIGSNFNPAPFAAVLNHLTTTADTGAYDCAQAGGTPRNVYNLRFSYLEGPDVVVQILDGCTPAVVNHNLASDDDSGIMALLRGAGVAQ